MGIVIIFIAILFSIFSTAVMSYIAMANPIGPWIELILVLLATLIFRFILCYKLPYKLKNGIGLTTAAGGISGITATVCGFSFPILYFLNKEIFNSWLSNPVHFCALLGGLVIAAGGFGFLIANILEKRFLEDSDRMPFPIGKMVSKMISAQNSARKAIELAIGSLLAFIFGFANFYKIIPNSLTLFRNISLGFIRIPGISINLSLLPVFVAIGFVAGKILTIPLIVGMISKLFLLNPLHKYWFSSLSSYEFTFAFLSGIVIQGVSLSFLRLPHVIISAFKRIKKGEKNKDGIIKFFKNIGNDIYSWIGIISFITFLIAYFSYFNFSLLSQLYLFSFTFICVYQLLIIGGKIGLAPMNRFSVFVMLPGIFIFSYNSVQIALVSTFVGLAGGVAVDAMFGRKMAQLSGIENKKVRIMQLVGLFVTAISIGVIFWFLINHFGLGSSELIAQRAQARALLVSPFSFNYYVIALGILFGFILKKLRVSAMLVFTGIIFKVGFSLMLITGGLLTYLTKDKEAYDPFWSGMFAAGSLWIKL